VQWWLDGEVDMTAPPGSFGSWVVLGFRDGKVRKVEALTGKVVWTAALDSFSERSMLLSGTTLYVMTAAQVLYALDFQSGKTLWLFDGGFPDGLAIRGGTRPLMHDNKVIVGISSGEILAVQAETGKLVWRYNPAYNDARFHDLVGDLVVRNNRLLISRYDGLVASVDLGSSVRKLIWQDQLPGITSSTFRGGRFFVGSLNGDVYAYDADSGRRLFRSVTGSPVTSITAGETSLYVAGGDGRVSALDSTSGDFLWHDDLGSQIAASPVLTEQTIYFETGLRNMYGYKLR
jgi:outer membrane protein assembly factor BamB